MRPLIFFMLVLGTGCATASEGTTWDEDAREGIAPAKARPEPHRSTIGVSSALDTSLSGPDKKTLAVDSTELELTLMRFVSKRRQIAQDLVRAHADRPAWPRPLESAFEAVMDELDRGLDAPKGSLPRRVLIQARVTMEVELENAESSFGTPPPELLQRMGKLFGAIAVHMRAIPAGEDERHARSGDRELALAWPVSPVIVTSPFGYRRDPILGHEDVRFHAGVDLGGESGDLVSASAPGHVVSAGWLGGSGRAVVVQHAGGYQTTYAHLRQIVVSIGTDIEAGAPIGLMGSTGRSTGPHLHFEVRRGGVPLDPLEILGPAFAASHTKGRESAALRD